jgi:leucyl aminopeptidase
VLLPDFPFRTRTAQRLTPRASAKLDAVVVFASRDAPTRAFAALPEPSRWAQLHARGAPIVDTVRTTTLANAHHTLAVVAYFDPDAMAFQLQALAARAIKEARARQPRHVALCVLADGAKKAPLESALLTAALAASYTPPKFVGKPRAEPQTEWTLVGEFATKNEAITAARANNRVRWLTSLPPNYLDARAYRRIVFEAAKRSRLAARWIDEAALRRLGAGAFLAVSAGNASRNDAGIVHLKYRGRKNKTTLDLALVGKGILFDTGGNNLKPHRAMLDMHIDMSGSAIALATLLALVERRAPINVDCWLAITENRIGPTAYRPQDVVRACNGVTIQVIHTDAEGRMVLADTLALASRAKPRLIFDFATLTGAAVYSLTERMGAILTNREHLHERLIVAGRTSGERVWPFPLDADFDTDIESKVADVQQCSVDGKGDHILAARFLQRFVPKESAWVHLDLSPALRHGGLGAVSTDITGFGARYALELLDEHRLLDHLEAKTR